MNKKILFAATSEGIQAGASRCYLNIVKEFVKRNIDFVCLLPKEGLMSEELKKLGVRYYTVYDFNGVWQVENDYRMNFVNYLKYVVKSFYNFFAVSRVKRIIRKEKIDIVHINSISRNVAALAALKVKVPYAWHIRELLEEQMDSKFVNYKYAYELMNSADNLICISKTVEDYYLKRFPFKNTCVIYDGIDVNSFYKEREIFVDNEIKIGIIGRVDFQKRQNIFLEACGLLKKEYPNIKCYVVGGYFEDEYYKQLKSVVEEYDIDGNVVFTGFVEDSSVYTKQCDIICACSHAEAFGLITVEALLSGALVIASDSGCNLELIKDNETGYLFRCDDIKDLYLKMKYAIENKNKSVVIAKDAQKYSLSYSLDNNINNILKCYDEVLDRRKNGI